MESTTVTIFRERPTKSCQTFHRSRSSRRSEIRKIRTRSAHSARLPNRQTSRRPIRNTPLRKMTRMGPRTYLLIKRKSQRHRDPHKTRHATRRMWVEHLSARLKTTMSSTNSHRTSIHRATMMSHRIIRRLSSPPRDRGCQCLCAASLELISPNNNIKLLVTTISMCGMRETSLRICRRNKYCRQETIISQSITTRMVGQTLLN